MAGYTRNDTPNNIADGNVINASDLDGEFDAIQTAFGTGGHTHDGTAGNGPQIGTGGIANDAVTLGTKTSGNYVAAGAVSGVGLSGSASAEGATFTVTSNATNANTASTIVARDASGNFNAGTITASLTGNVTGNLTGNVTGNVTGSSGSTTGNAATATALQTARTIAGQSFDGTANITIASTDLSDSGSIDATTLDSIDSTQFLRSDAADNKTSGDLTFNDNVKANFGSGNDLQIYHTGGSSILYNTHPSNLFLASQGYTFWNSAFSEVMLNAVQNGAVTLYYDNSAKLATASGGVSITGELTADTVDATTLQIGNTSITATAAELNYNDITALGQVQASKTVTADSSGFVNFGDNEQIRFGTGNDLQIFHDGVNSYISETGTGHLRIRGGNLFLEEPGGGNFIGMTDGGTGGTVTLYHNASAKLATKSDGVEITGELQATSLDINGNADISGQLTMGGNVNLQDNDKLQLGSSQDLQIYHNGTASYIEDVGTGNLIIRGTDINIQDREGNNFIFCDDTGTGGTIYLYHNNSSKLNTTSTGINIDGNINAVDDITIAGSIYHEGDTDSYFGFHAANQWRVVTGGTEMLEVNDSYINLNANSKGRVQTTSLTGSNTPDFYQYNSFVWTLTGNITLGNPATEQPGMSGVFIFIHSGAGRTVSLGTQYITVGGAGLTLSGTSGAVDIVPYFVRANGIILLGTPQLAFS